MQTSSKFPHNVAPRVSRSTEYSRRGWSRHIAHNTCTSTKLSPLYDVAGYVHLAVRYVSNLLPPLQRPYRHAYRTLGRISYPPSFPFFCTKNKHIDIHAYIFRLHRWQSIVNPHLSMSAKPRTTSLTINEVSIYTLCRANNPQVRQPIKVVRKRMVVKLSLIHI